MIRRARRFAAAVRADITKILRDRTTLALMLAQAIIVMALLGIVFGEGIRDIPIVVVDRYHDPLSESIVHAITGSDQFQVVAYLGSEDEAKQYIDAGRAQGAIIIENDLTEAMFTGKEAKVKILVDGSQPMVQYTFRALGTALTSEIQRQVYENILKGIEQALTDVERYQFVAESATPVSEDLLASTERYYGTYQGISTGASMSAGTPGWISAAEMYGYSTAEALNQRMSSTGVMLTSMGKAVGSVANGYDQTADQLEPIAEYLIQKGTAEGDLNLIQTGYKLQYIAAGLRMAYDQFKSAGLDDKLKAAGAGMSAMQIPTPQAYRSIGATAAPATVPRISKEEIQEIVRSLRESLRKASVALAATNGSFNLEYDVMYNGDKLRILDLLTPLLLALFVAMGTLATTAPMVVKEKERGILERISTTPIPPLEYILSKILAALAVTTVQVIVLILVGVFAFRIYIGGGIWMLLLILLPVALSHIGMGILISTRAKSEREAVQAIPAIMVPSIILSGITFPISMLPAYIRPLAYLVPLTYCQRVLMGVMVKGASFSTYLPDLIALFVFAAIFLAGGVIAFVKSTRQ